MRRRSRHRVELESDHWTLTLFADNPLNSRARSMINHLDVTSDGESTITRVTPGTVGMRMEWRF